MVTDIHSHIIFGVDDGAKSEVMSYDLLNMAAAEGIQRMIATPHFSTDMPDKLVSRRIKHFLKLREYASSMNPPMRLALGSELYWSEDIIEALESGKALTINKTRYVLVEFPVYTEYPSIDKAVRKLTYAGYIPILAHIERFEGTSKEENVAALIEAGAYMQINTEAVTGKAGFFKKMYVLKLIKNGMIHFLGTDAHRVNWRPPKMAEAMSIIEKKCGADMVYRLTEENPKKLLKGERI